MPNFGQMIGDSARDIAAGQELIVPGFWQIRLRRGRPWIPAKTFWTASEPGNPGNVRDRWPPLVIAAEILGEFASPLEVFGAPERRPLQPLITSDARLSITQHYRYLVALGRYKMQHEGWDPRALVDLTRVAPLF